MPRLLLVDDNPSIHKIAESLLAGTDVQLVCASGGQQALDLLQDQEPFDAALVDLCMQGMDGWELLDRIRAHETAGRLPVALMAGVLDSIDPERVAKAPVQGFLKKPVELRDLAQRVHSLKDMVVVLPEPEPKTPLGGSPFETIPSMKLSDFPEFREPLPAESAPDALEEDVLLLTAEDLLPEAVTEHEPLVLAETGEEDTATGLEPAPQPISVPAFAPVDSSVSPFDFVESAAPAPELEPELEDLTPTMPESLPREDVSEPLPTQDLTAEPALEVELPDLGNAVDPDFSSGVLESEPSSLDLDAEPAPEPTASPDLPQDWADESESLLTAIESALPPVPSPDIHVVTEVSAVPVEVSAPQPTAPELERQLDAAIQAGAMAAAAAEAPPEVPPVSAPVAPSLVEPAPSQPSAPVLPGDSSSAEALVAAIAADPALAQQLAKALMKYLPEAALREVAWDVLPELADRLRRY